MTRPKSSISALLTEVLSGKSNSLGKLLSEIENGDPKAVYNLPGFMNPPQCALRLGITGPPGAGKSTLVSALIGKLRAQNLKVAVLAVDPSSPFTGGAILGDRIRYQDHVLDEGVFIRSLGTRGSLGGLSASAHRLLRVFDLCKFDVVLVETVGVGQTELDILHVADEVVVVLVPESGDSIQAMKAGLMEVADIFVVNKADRPGASAMAKDIESSFIGELDGKEPPKVYLTTATKSDGLDPLTDDILKMLKSKEFVNGRADLNRLQHEFRMILRQKLEGNLLQEASQVKSSTDFLKRL